MFLPEAFTGKVLQVISYRQDTSIQTVLGYLSLNFSTLKSVQESENRLLTKINQVNISLALGIYYQQHRTYPAKLSDLMRNYLKQLPNDPYSEKPFLYKKEKTGFLLYSVGNNRVDDGGQWKHSEQLDDLSVRVSPTQLIP